jgi:hypothetical protein
MVDWLLSADQFHVTNMFQAHWCSSSTSHGQHAAGIVLDRRELERNGLQRCTHVDRIAACVAQHQAREGLLRGIRCPGQLRPERLLRNMRYFERLATDLLKDADHVQRAQRLGPPSSNVAFPAAG